MNKLIQKLFYLEEDKKVIYPLYTFRFILFIFIFVHHCYGNVQIPILRQPALAVSGFFILSGFLNSYIYLNKVKLKDTISFTIKRIKKMWLLHIVILIITIGVSGVFNITTSKEMIIFIKKLICNALLLQSWVNDKSYYFSFNGATWFLSTYLFLSLITVPILCLLKKANNKKHRNLLLILISLILFIISLLIVYLLKKENYESGFYEYWIYIFPPARIIEYTIGMIFGIIYKNNKVSFKYDKMVFSIIELLSIAFLIWIINSHISHKYIFLDDRLNTWIIPVIITLLVFSYQKGIFSKLFSAKITVYLGKISMYMFIIHQPLIYYMTRSNGNVIHYRYLALYMLLLTILIAYIINNYEVIKTSKKIIKKK